MKNCATRPLCDELCCDFEAMTGKSLCRYHEHLRNRKALRKVNEEPRRLNWPFIGVLAGVIAFWTALAWWIFSK